MIAVQNNDEACWRLLESGIIFCHFLKLMVMIEFLKKEIILSRFILCVEIGSMTVHYS